MSLPPAPEPLRRDVAARRRASRGGVRRAVGVTVALAAVAGLVAGWFWAPLGRPDGPNDLVAATTAPAVSPLAALEPGTCLTDFESMTAATFTPVDCATPHTAEVLARVPVASQFPEAGESWPGDAELATRVSLACQDPAVLDLDAAAKVDGLAITARWPATQAEWDAGFRDYLCVAVDASGALVGSLRP